MRRQPLCQRLLKIRTPSRRPLTAHNYAYFQSEEIAMRLPPSRRKKYYLLLKCILGINRKVSKSDSTPSNARSFMRLIPLVSTALLNAMLAIPAYAGAAGGTPSPFMPPFPDEGCGARCIVRHEAELRCRLMAQRNWGEPYLSAASADTHCNYLRHRSQLASRSGN
jgi:hypothetical protein